MIPPPPPRSRSHTHTYTHTQWSQPAIVLCHLISPGDLLDLSLSGGNHCGQTQADIVQQIGADVIALPQACKSIKVHLSSSSGSCCRCQEASHCAVRPTGSAGKRGLFLWQPVGFQSLGRRIGQDQLVVVSLLFLSELENKRIPFAALLCSERNTSHR